MAKKKVKKKKVEIVPGKLTLAKNGNASADNYMPTVLEAALENEKWFVDAKGELNYSGVDMQAEFYHEHIKITIDANWYVGPSYETCIIKMQEPSVGDQYTSNNIKGIVKRIKAEYDKGVVSANRTAEIQKESDARHERQDNYIKRLIADFDGKLTEEYSDYTAQNCEGGRFTMGFHRDDYKHELDDKDVMFEIGEISGTFTLDEIKILQKLVCGNPRAIAERLLKNN